MTMTPQERDVISGIFDRLKQASNVPRDPEADKLIADRLKEQPYAAYAMAQSVYVQEQALLNLQQQMEQLQGEVARLQSAANQAQPAQNGFLSSIFGAKPAVPTPTPGRPMGLPPTFGGQNQPQQAGMPNQGMQNPGMMAAQPNYPPQQQAPGPWGGAAAPRQGGGFMQTAMATAAGVAGGVVLGNVLMNAFGGSQGAGQNAAASSPAGATGNEAMGPYAAASTDQAPGAEQPQAQTASYDDNQGGYDPGFDSGGDGDWA
jgi:uncharacterized protein